MLTKIKAFLLPFGLLAGTIIGAGVFSLPYLFKFSGFVLGFIYLALAGFAYVVLYRMYADIVKETPGEHRFVGFARIYLGRYASWLAFLIAIVEGILVLTIYLILSQSFFNLFIYFGASIEKLVVFWFLGSAALLIGLKKISRLELAATLSIIAIFILIFIWGIPGFDTFSVFDFKPVWGNFLILLAPVLFSLSGRAAIPGVVKLGGPTKSAITWGVIISALLYALFAVSVVAISPIVTEDAVTGLRAGLPLWFGSLLGILGILSLLTSYVAVGYDVDRTLELDLGISGWKKFALVMFGPLVLYFGGLQDFLYSVGLAGGIFIAAESILIVWMWLKMKRRRFSWPAGFLVVLFSVAIAYEVIKSF